MNTAVAVTIPLDLTPLTDAELAALLSQVADDDAQVERILAVLDARGGDADGDPTDTPAAPVEDDEPPMTPEEYRRAFIQQYRAPGESIVQAADRYYGEITYERWERAEQDCRGRLLTREGEAAGIDPYSLFHGNATRAHKWASDELLAWWGQHGRVSWAEHMAEWTGYSRYSADAARARNAWNACVIRGRKRRSVLDGDDSHRPERGTYRKFGARD